MDQLFFKEGVRANKEDLLACLSVFEFQGLQPFKEPVYVACVDFPETVPNISVPNPKNS